MPRFQLPRINRPSGWKKRRAEIPVPLENGHIPDSASSQKLLDSAKIRSPGENGKGNNSHQISNSLC